MDNSVKKYYNQFKEHFNKLDLPANIIVTIVVGIFLLWILLGFSGSIIVVVLLVTNIVCLYYLYKKDYIKLNT